jgi:hypothetical protein
VRGDGPSRKPAGVRMQHSDWWRTIGLPRGACIGRCRGGKARPSQGSTAPCAGRFPPTPEVHKWWWSEQEVAWAGRRTLLVGTTPP